MDYGRRSQKQRSRRGTARQPQNGHMDQDLTTLVGRRTIAQAQVRVVTSEFRGTPAKCACRCTEARSQGARCGGCKAADQTARTRINRRRTRPRLDARPVSRSRPRREGVLVSDLSVLRKPHFRTSDTQCPGGRELARGTRGVGSDTPAVRSAPVSGQFQPKNRVY